MRWFTIALSIFGFALPIVAQRPPAARMGVPFVDQAESAIKQASERLVTVRKVAERDVAVLAHLRNADQALADPMQPDNAIQKAYEEVQAAGMSEPGTPPPPFIVAQGLIAIRNELEDARRSPASTDFGHLRSDLREKALGPASRIAVADATRLEFEVNAWLKVQALIAAHLQALSDIATNSIRAAEQE